MRLVSELANRILGEVRTLTKENLIIVNQAGVIIASTNQARVGDPHEGATVVMNTGKKLYITHEIASKLQGVKTGINLPITFENEIIGVIGITGIPTDVEPFAELIRRMTELIIREANYIEQKEWKTRGFESFFYEWIYTTGVDDNLIKRGEILGMSFDIPYQCILIQLDPALITENLIQVENYMDDWFVKEFSREQGDFLIRWGNGRFLLINSQSHKISASNLLYRLTKWQKYFQEYHQIPLAIGVGKTFNKWNISDSYDEASKALNIAEKNYSIVFYERLLLDIILGELKEETREEYLHRVLVSIRNEKDLIDTLRVYLINNQSLIKSSDVLHIHINTLHYRLNQIKEMTGIDPKSSEGIALFYIALDLVNTL